MHFLFRDCTGHQKRAALVAGLAPVAQRVGLAGRLDLDHLGAHVAEQPSGERPCEQRPELDHAHPGERAGPALYHAVHPPSTARTCPVTSEACAEARKTTAPTTSAG